MSCAVCGTENRQEARFCQACGAPLGASGAAPDRLVAGRRPARLGDRLFAVLLDLTLFSAGFALAGTWAAARWGGVTERGFDVNATPVLLLLGGVALLLLLYHWLLEAMVGATVGKAIVGVKVCDDSGHACGLRRSLVRNLLRLVDALAVVGLLIAAFSKKRQRLGDHLAGTYVVERSGGRLWRGPLALLWAGGIGAALWGAFVIHRAAPKPAATTPVEASAAAPVSVPTAILVSGDLKLEDFAFLEDLHGAARAPRPFKPRERLFAHFQAKDLAADAEGRIHMRYGVEAVDPNGILIQTLTKELDGAPGGSTTAKVSVWLDVPLSIPSGTAKLRVTAHDNVSNKDGEIEASFLVDSKARLVSRELEIRDLRFSASEGGPTLDPAVIAPGDRIFVEGQLAGVQFRGDQVDVGIALRVLDPSGGTVLDKPDFLTLRSSYVYHPPTFYVPIKAHLRLPFGTPKGTYREEYLVTDRIAGATRSYHLVFEVE